MAYKRSHLSGKDDINSEKFSRHRVICIFSPCLYVKKNQFMAAQYHKNGLGSLLLFINLALSLLVLQAAFGEESSGVFINELELNPPPGETQWIELYNPTKSSASLNSLELLSVDDDGEKVKGFNLSHISQENIIQPGEYYVVQIGEQQNNFFDHRLNSFVLSDGQTTLDSVRGLSDELANERTWQRFPDGRDTGEFRDWTFRPASKGEGNSDAMTLVAECSLDPFCWGILDVYFHRAHIVKVEGSQFSIDTLYDSTLLRVDLIPEEKKITIKKPLVDLSGGDRPPFMHVTIPTELLSGTYSVNSEKNELPFEKIDNGTHSRLIIGGLSNEGLIEITGTVIVPEFPVGTLMPMVAAIFLVILLKQRFWKY